MTSALLSVITALIGVIGGFLLARFQASQSAKLASHRAEAERQAQLQSLAMDIVKVELERAEREGRRSPHPAIAHFTVISSLLQQYDVSLRREDLQNTVRLISDSYHGHCRFCDLPVCKCAELAEALSDDASAT